MAENGQEKNKIQNKSSKAQIIKFVIILVLAAGVILGLYLRMINQSKNSDQQAEENMTEAEILKTYDLDAQYPINARDVVKLHCRYLKCLYNEELEEAEYEQLNTQIRKLFAGELLDSNPEADQFSDMQEEVEGFRSAGKVIISYAVDSEANVKYYTIDNVDYAAILVTCSIKEGNKTDTLEEEYLLCKEENQWKILGWQGLTVEDLTEAENAETGE